AVTSEYGNVVIYHPTGDAVKRLKKSTADLPGRIDGVRTLEIHEGVEAPPDAV
ncbi:MAG: cytidylate kinase-like family protein, partial [Deltaproteobacteria bacterium]